MKRSLSKILPLPVLCLALVSMAVAHGTETAAVNARAACFQALVEQLPEAVLIL